MTQPLFRRVSRRRFLSSTAVGAAALAAPAVLVGARSGRGAEPVVVGEGEYRYEVYDQWAKLPERFTWQTTHNVAVDRENNLYVIHEGRAEQIFPRRVCGEHFTHTSRSAWSGRASDLPLLNRTS